MSARDPLTAALITWRNAEAAAALGVAGTPIFISKPDAWYDDPHWFCGSGHVSARFLNSDENGPVCLACGLPVVLGPAIGEAQFAPILEGLKALLEARGQ